MTRRRSPVKNHASRLECAGRLRDEPRWPAIVVIVVMVLVVVLTASGLDHVRAVEAVLVAGLGGVEIARRLLRRVPGSHLA
ncbi:hypothetical protein Ssi03_40380 [Sphaerisporangium siamense]|uniref:Uncharacterized protein n=1 Tax=Sphaerisporangium siamense TaxID=795645 RepID=A0A7W7D8C6_9ACTN|nr:hypothetical protein [Sphaerisporangium siamense]MBB4700806.1 hypothetical protein [Sphaerisporangium siamense]GII86048.1 hypothetical protein Ssi03_40380 [Sphaerisporangium siamense]